MVSRHFLQKQTRGKKNLNLVEIRLLTCLSSADKFFSPLGSSPSTGSLAQQPPVPESSTGDKEKEKWVVENIRPSGTPLPKGSDTQRKDATGVLYPQGHQSESPCGRSLPRFPRTLWRTSQSHQLGLLSARDLLLPQCPSLQSSISVLCWTRFGPRKASNGCPMNRSRPIIERVCECSRG